MFRSLLEKIKAWGVGHAIDALDNLKRPLSEQINAELDKIRKLNSDELADYLVEAVKKWLRLYFNIPQS